MDNNNSKLESTTASEEKLVASLENLLEKQLKLMQSSKDKAALQLAVQTTDCVNIIGQKKILNNDKFATQRKNIERLFKELTLTTAERKVSITSELNKMRKGKITVGAYKNKIASTHSNLL